MSEQNLFCSKITENNDDVSYDTDDELAMLSNDSWEENFEEPFYFESDHLALKGNGDYHQLLRTVFILEAQRARAVSDLNTLLSKQSEALADPLAFVEKLQKGQSLDLPIPQQIAEIPKLEWDSYALKFDFNKHSNDIHMTRFKKEKEYADEDNKPLINAPSSSLGSVVRGRVKGTRKPETFNQLWTVEEQLRLEELLIKYPPEEIESHRYDKIARELGNRTRQQVASRVQKYFIKLARARLPVPGRVPSANLCHQKLTKKRSRRHQGKVFRHSSTFMVKYEPPVYMPEDDDASSVDSYGLSQAGVSWSAGQSAANERWSGQQYGDQKSGYPFDQEFSETPSYASDESDDDLPASVKDTEEYCELQQLRRLRNTLLAKSNGGNESRAATDFDSD